MDTASIVAFSAVAALLTVTPGADMALVTRNALDGGQRAAFATTLGIVTGIMAWALLSAVGIAALLAASATAFSILKLAGAAYLVVLGVRAIWRSRGRATPERDAPPERVGERGSPFLQGLLTNLLNPKIAVFYTTLLPQFIVPGDPVLIKSLVLAAIHNALGLVWLSGYAWAVTTAGDLLRRPRARRALNRLTGVVLIALGMRLALERR